MSEGLSISIIIITSVSLWQIKDEYFGSHRTLLMLFGCLGDFLYTSNCYPLNNQCLHKLTRVDAQTHTHKIQCVIGKPWAFRTVINLVCRGQRLMSMPIPRVLHYHTHYKRFGSWRAIWHGLINQLFTILALSAAEMLNNCITLFNWDSPSVVLKQDWIHWKIKRSSAEPRGQTWLHLVRPHMLRH